MALRSPLDAPLDRRADPLGDLPEHLALQVLGKLDSHRDVLLSAQVTSRWRHLAGEDALWSSFYARAFPGLGRERLLLAERARLLERGWRERFRWRLGLEGAWLRGAHRLACALEGHAAWVNAVALSDAGLVVSGGSEGAVRAWRLKGGEPAASLDCHDRAVWSISAEGACALSGGADGVLCLSDLQAGAVLQRVSPGQEGQVPHGPPGSRACVPSVQMLPGGQVALAGRLDGRLSLLDLRSGRSELGWSAFRGGGGGQPAADLSEMTQLSVARAEGHVVIVGGDATVLPVFDTRALGGSEPVPVARLLAHPLAQNRPQVFSLDVHHPWMCCAGSDGHVQLWNLGALGGRGGAGGTCAQGMVASNSAARRAAAGGAHARMVYGSKLLADGRVLTVAHDGLCRLWEAGGGGHWAAGAQLLRTVWEFAPSLTDPEESMVVDPLTGFLLPLPMHAVDCSLTHVVAAGRDSVVRVFALDPA